MNNSFEESPVNTSEKSPAKFGDAYELTNEA